MTALGLIVGGLFTMSTFFFFFLCGDDSTFWPSLASAVVTIVTVADVAVVVVVVFVAAGAVVLRIGTGGGLHLVTDLLGRRSPDVNAAIAPLERAVAFHGRQGKVRLRFYPPHSALTSGAGVGDEGRRS